MNDKELLLKALEARTYAYAPYSGFMVGAALLCEDGSIYTGCNIENAAYTPTNCAERTAFFKAVSEGKRRFSAIAIVGGAKNVMPQALCAPCGVCRQIMMEFCDPSTFRIVLGCKLNTDTEEIKVFTLQEMMPMGFGPENLA